MTDRAALLDALLADPTRAASVPRADALALLVELARVQRALELLPASTPAPAAELNGDAPASPDRQLTVVEAAERLGVTPRWIRDHRGELGAWKSGGTMRIPEKGIDRFKARKRV